jgi:hypothetical protein
VIWGRTEWHQRWWRTLCPGTCAQDCQLSGRQGCMEGKQAVAIGTSPHLVELVQWPGQVIDGLDFRVVPCVPVVGLMPPAPAASACRPQPAGSPAAKRHGHIRAACCSCPNRHRHRSCWCTAAELPWGGGAVWLGVGRHLAAAAVEGACERGAHAHMGGRGRSDQTWHGGQPAMSSHRTRGGGHWL